MGSELRLHDLGSPNVGDEGTSQSDLLPGPSSLFHWETRMAIALALIGGLVFCIALRAFFGD